MKNKENNNKKIFRYIVLALVGMGVIIGGRIAVNGVMHKLDETIPLDVAEKKAEDILNKKENKEFIEDVALQLEEVMKNIKTEDDLIPLINESPEEGREMITIEGINLNENVYFRTLSYNFYDEGEKIEDGYQVNICKPRFIFSVTSAPWYIAPQGYWMVDITVPFIDNYNIIGEVTVQVDVTNIKGLPKNVVQGANIELDSDGPLTLSKPVIYLYPKEVQNVKVNLDYDGDLFVTYPQYDDKKGWNVTAYPDGKIINNEDGLEYSYLFWDGFSDKLNPTFEEGFIVKGSDTLKFLQDILPKMGMTPKEYNEFIVYWLPIMQGNEYNLIKFLDKEYTDIAKLDISPKPDSVLRVFMAFKGINKNEADKLKATIVKQEIKPFDRSGFTVVEWGGTEIK